MRRPASIAAAGACTLAVMLAAAPSAAAASLPSVRSGERPGPPLLYERPPQVPQLENSAPFRASPLLVSGTDAYRDGEYLYQDYLFDDRGADTLEGSLGQRDSDGNFSPTSGNLFYPTASRYGQNAADIVELRIKPTENSIVYRITLNTVKADDAAIVGLGIDTDRDGGSEVPWPAGAGVTSPGLDRFITAWGTGGRVYQRDVGTGQFVPQHELDGDQVSISRRSNQMTVRVPRKFMNPGLSSWRYVAGAGLRSADNGFKEPRQGPPTDSEPGTGDPTEGAPGVFNLAFRFDEPQTSQPTPSLEPTPGFRTMSETTIGIGNWFESRQARTLKEPTPVTPPSTGGFRADVSFRELADGARANLHAPGRDQARIFASSLETHEGFQDPFPSYGGPLQPYMLRLPGRDRPSRPRGLTWSLHSLGGTYTQYAVFNDNLLRQFGDQRDDLVVTPLGRGPDGWYMDEAEVDFFEVWRDVARHFTLDPERVGLTGYSMGGYGTYRLGALYPDLFGRAFTAVGPPARGGWVPPAPPFDPDSGEFTQYTNSNKLLENLRWIPYMNWVGEEDQLVPIPGPQAQQRRFDRLALRSQLWTFLLAEHFTLAIRDEWEEAKDHLAGARVERTPTRVNYALMPDTWRGRFGLVHDHAYWVSDLRARDTSGDPNTDPARAEINAISRAFGEEDHARTAPINSADPGPPPSTIEGTRWTGIASRPAVNALDVVLENLKRATIDGRGARLDGDRRLRVRIDADGEGTMRLDLPLPAGAQVRRIDGGPVSGPGREVTLDRGGASFRVDRGSRTYNIE